MRLGLFGGSFDPVHRGHVDPILEAKAAAGLDRVIYLPTARPPHKEDRDLAPAEHRFAMVELALAEHPGLEVSPYEMGLDRPAYTVETLEHFRAERPDDELFLVIGADSFLSLDRWRRCEDLPRLARLVVLVRPGWDPGSTPESVRRLLGEREPLWVENRPVAASSTEIRRRISRGEALEEDWLPGPVLQYVYRNRLYAESP